MTGCTFCDGPGTTEFKTYEAELDEDVTFWLCPDCTEKYDKAVGISNE